MPPRACRRAAAAHGAPTLPGALPPLQNWPSPSPHLLGCCGLQSPAAHFQRAIIPLLTHRSCTTAGRLGLARPPPRRISLSASLRPLTNQRPWHARPPRILCPQLHPACNFNCAARARRRLGSDIPHPAAAWPPLHASPMTRLQRRAVWRFFLLLSVLFGSLGHSRPHRTTLNACASFLPIPPPTSHLHGAPLPRTAALPPQPLPALCTPPGRRAYASTRTHTSALWLPRPLFIRALYICHLCIPALPPLCLETLLPARCWFSVPRTIPRVGILWPLTSPKFNPPQITCPRCRPPPCAAPPAPTPSFLSKRLLPLPCGAV